MSRKSNAKNVIWDFVSILCGQSEDKDPSLFTSFFLVTKDVSSATNNTTTCAEELLGTNNNTVHTESPLSAAACAHCSAFVPRTAKEMLIKKTVAANDSDGRVGARTEYAI